MNRFYGSTRAVMAIILTVDVLFLVGLPLLGICWLLVKDTWTWGWLEIPFQWRDSRLLWLAALLLMHGVAAYGATGLDRGRLLGLFRYRAVQRFIMVFVMCAVSLAVMESVLKAAHVDIRIAPMVLKTRESGKEKYGPEMLADPELIFKFVPGSTISGRKINRYGFRDREFEIQKPEGVRRVICLGDSVTAQGLPGYAQYLHDMLTNAPPDGATWDAYSLGVYGYSSLQGLRLLRLFGKDMQPDVVTVSFGRNDHNLAKVTDHARMAVRLSPFMRALHTVLGRRTVGRLVLHALDRSHERTAIRGADDVRVPPDQFRDNMRAFVREIRDMDAVPVLITAPRREMPETYVEQGNAHSTAEYERQHDEYAEIVRQVARETGAPLLDLQRIMAAPECDQYFEDDAVHLDNYDDEERLTIGQVDQPGLRLVASELYKVISTNARALPPVCAPVRRR